MREKPLEDVEIHRITEGERASKIGDTFGCFAMMIKEPRGGKKSRRTSRRVGFYILSSGADSETGWEHVSVSVQGRAPDWGEMDWVKKCFWSDDEVVIQFHVNDDRKVNKCGNALHLWRKTGKDAELPPPILV